MSLESDKTRLINAKSDLETYLVSNGITVAADATIDEMVALLGNVKTGGYASGSTTITFNTGTTQSSAHYWGSANTPDEWLVVAEPGFTPDGIIINGEWLHDTLANVKFVSADAEHTSDLGYYYLYISSSGSSVEWTSGKMSLTPTGAYTPEFKFQDGKVFLYRLGFYCSSDSLEKDISTTINWIAYKRQ